MGTLVVKCGYFFLNRHFRFNRVTQNSEKYVVCKGFIGIEPSDLEKMYSVVDDWDILDNQLKYVENIFNIHVPMMFDKVIESYNIYSTSRQIQTILKTFSYIHAHIQNKDMNNIKQKQAIIGLLWCKKYDLPINYNCTFLNVGEEYNYILYNPYNPRIF